ncbi:hypothetical protein WMY93_007835 [Mugilogobius chulae]|uniref:Uncharacterized protein n=1 Tax=Mugilogobius chulae TaxID=88201 RepID=A0AAW0PHT0_9GOBI
MAATTFLVTLGCLLLLQGIFSDKGPEAVPLTLTVENTFSNAVPDTYVTSIVEGSVLLSALRRLQESQQDFKFTVKEDPDFGLFLESVNELSGDKSSYWEILAENSGELTRLDVGVGCYKPKAFEHIILRFKKSF